MIRGLGDDATDAGSVTAVDKWNRIVLRGTSQIVIPEIRDSDQPRDSLSNFYSLLSFLRSGIDRVSIVFLGFQNVRVVH